MDFRVFVAFLKSLSQLRIMEESEEMRVKMITKELAILHRAPVKVIFYTC